MRIFSTFNRGFLNNDHNLNPFWQFKSEMSIIDAPDIKKELVSCVRHIRNFPWDGLDEAVKRILEHPDDEAPKRILETS